MATVLLAENSSAAEWAAASATFLAVVVAAALSVVEVRRSNKIRAEEQLDKARDQAWLVVFNFGDSRKYEGGEGTEWDFEVKNHCRYPVKSVVASVKFASGEEYERRADVVFSSELTGLRWSALEHEVAFDDDGSTRQPELLVVQFTDVTGRRWRRTSRGELDLVKPSVAPRWWTRFRSSR